MCGLHRILKIYNFLTRHVHVEFVVAAVGMKTGLDEEGGCVPVAAAAVVVGMIGDEMSTVAGRSLGLALERSCCC